MPKRSSIWQRINEQDRTLLDASGPAVGPHASQWRRFVHFWVLVWVSFNRNRCPVHASGLAYATLLALIPKLAVVMSITSSMHKEKGEDRINESIGKMVASITPPAPLHLEPAEPPDLATNQAPDAVGQWLLRDSFRGILHEHRERHGRGHSARTGAARTGR